jgi:hypothetical protein
MLEYFHSFGMHLATKRGRFLKTKFYQFYIHPMLCESKSSYINDIFQYSFGWKDITLFVDFLKLFEEIFMVEMTKWHDFTKAQSPAKTMILFEIVGQYRGKIYFATICTNLAKCHASLGIGRY